MAGQGKCQAPGSPWPPPAASPPAVPCCCGRTPEETEMMHAKELALLLVRVIVGITMIAHGYNHWRRGGRIAGTARWFSGLGLRHGTLQAWMSVVTELGAGALLIMG